jgi:hypothetical protein
MTGSDDKMSPRNETIGRSTEPNRKGGRNWPNGPRPGIHTWLESRSLIQWIGLTILAMLGVIGFFALVVLCAAGISKLLP